jgi:ribosome-associated translation inhibitor RaiA
MQTAPEIDFQGMAASPEVRVTIDKRIAELEQRYGRLTGCRIVVKVPGEHHHQGGLYDVHIRLVLPESREVNVARNPPKDERHADLTFALDEAFRRARRPPVWLR